MYDLLVWFFKSWGERLRRGCVKKTKRLFNMCKKKLKQIKKVHKAKTTKIKETKKNQETCRYMLLVW